MGLLCLKIVVNISQVKAEQTSKRSVNEVCICIFLSGYVKHPDRDIYSALALKSNVI
jgi:hypothetical protein